MNNINLIDKIAFMVHEPVMFVHYEGVWKNLSKESFDIVLIHRCENKLPKQDLGVDDLIEKIKKIGCTVEYYTQVLKKGHKYRYVVSNHYLDDHIPEKIHSINRIAIFVKRISGLLGLTKSRLFSAPDNLEKDHTAPPPERIGINQIRFMYGADISDNWSLGEWNRMYDLFLCHGPNDAAELSKRFKGKTEIMGYPRYDGYFNKNLDISPIRSEFDINPSKKTILWMPTTGEGACSIPDFAHQISKLISDYNVIVRPHPISFRADPEYIELLRSLNYKIDSTPLRDMNVLYKAVDFVLCDYGGSAFGVIYLDKNLILLDVSGSEKACTVVNSSNLEIKDYFPVIRQGDTGAIERIISNEQIWEDQRKHRQLLFRKYFANNRGKSADQAAKILGNLDSILN